MPIIASIVTRDKNNNDKKRYDNDRIFSDNSFYPRTDTLYNLILMFL